MNQSLQKLRRKYCVTAALIVFAVILLMVIMINLFMEINARQERDLIEDTVIQAAVAHSQPTHTEHILLQDTEKTAAGESIIPRDVRDVSSITLYGTIRCKDTHAIWYSAGGGLLFEMVNETGASVMVYKDYTFNKDVTNVSVDFNSYDTVKLGYETISIQESDITGNYFLLSNVWWKNSSSVPEGEDENVTLEITALDIHYKEDRAIPEVSGQMITHMTFGDIFEEQVPPMLNNTGIFYLITDQENHLLTVNDGNLTEALSNEAANDDLRRIAQYGKQQGTLKSHETVYHYRCHPFGQQQLILMINDSLISQTSRNLLWITAGVSLLIWLIFLVLIYKISGYVIQPVAKSLEQQKHFISNASHELKTPITVISATIDIIEKKKGADCWTACIREQARKMKQLVSELLELSRLLEVHTARNAFTETDLSTTVSNALLYFECLFFEREKHLRQEIQEGLMLMTDETKITQLVGILVDNALKYSDPDSTITVKLYREKDHVILSCENPCESFAAEDASRLFERFYRSDNDRSQEQEGFGLGLSIAQAIVELHHGKIQATYHQPDITFTVHLPM